MIEKNNIIALRMERQYLTRKATESEYIALYRDLQPGYNVYWNGFGDPPTLTYRAVFDDMEFNRERQKLRKLIKGRFVGGNLGWIVPEDLELFAGAFRKPLDKPTERQLTLLELIEREGPLNIQLMKEITGMLVKEITPTLHRLQEAFLIYEDQYDGEWDRGWYNFGEIFPDIDLTRSSRIAALKILIQRFAYRMVWFDAGMAKSFYKLSRKDIKAALYELVTDNILQETDGGYILSFDAASLQKDEEKLPSCVFALHKNDALYRSHEHMLKDKWKCDGVETLYYILVDGEFHGAAYGKFRYGPPDLPDLVVDLLPDEAARRKDEIIEAVKLMSYGKAPGKYNGEAL